MSIASSNQSIEVALEEPVDLVRSLDIFRRNGDDLIDRFDGTTFVRTVGLDRGRVGVALRVGANAPASRLEAFVEDGAEITERDLATALREQFVTASQELEHLARTDPVIFELARKHRGLAVVLQRDLLHALVRCISAQQVNLAWATTTRARLVRLFGTPHQIGPYTAYSIDAARLAAAEVAVLRSAQFTVRKSQYLISTAAALANGSLRTTELDAMEEDETIVARLTALRGIGPWTADWILARTLGRPRVAAEDLGVRKAVAHIYGYEHPISPAQVRSLTAHWKGAASVCQQLALEELAQQRRAGDG